MYYGPLYSGILAHQLIEVNTSLYVSLAVISLFVIGLLLFRKSARMPKGLIISFLISYVIVLINILQIAFHLRIPNVIGNPCFAAGIYPTLFLVSPIVVLLERLFGSGWWTMFFNNLCIDSFCITALVIFAIIRLFLYIKRKASVKKTANGDLKGVYCEQ
jgi:hypothetical protein